MAAGPAPDGGRHVYIGEQKARRIVNNFTGGGEKPQPIDNSPPRFKHPFMGREKLLETLQDVLKQTPESPAIALIGAPGIGKTESALEVKARAAVRERFPDGVLWATLGKTAHAPGELTKWATELGIDLEKPDFHSLDAIRAGVKDRLKFRRMVLVVDDAWNEKELPLFDVGGRYCAFLVTTRRRDLREASDLTASYVVPALEPQAALQLLQHFTKISIQGDSGAAATINTVEGKPLASVLMEIVAKVNGHPLALVLIGRRLQAAARGGIESLLGETLSRLQADLTGGDNSSWDSGDADTSPRSLEAAVRISVEAIDPIDRHVLYAASVFPPLPGTFSSAAFDYVTGSADSAPLQRLLDSGLIENAGRNRFGIYAVISSFARNRVEAFSALRAKRDEAADRHIAYYCKQWASAPLTRRQCGDDYPNILAAMQQAVARQRFADMDSALDVFERHVDQNALYASPPVIGLFSEARRQLGEAIAKTRPTPASGPSPQYVRPYARVLLVIADIHRKLSDYDNAYNVMYHFDSLRPDLAGMPGGQLLELRGDEILLQLHQVLFRNVDQIAARVLSTLRSLSDSERARFAGVFRVLGEIFTNRGFFRDARRFLNQAISLANAARSPEALSGAHLARGAFDFVERRYAEAEELLADGFAIASKENHLERMVALLHMRSAAAHHSTPPRLDEASRHIAHALRLLRGIGHKWYQCCIYVECGEYLRKTGRFRTAAAALDKAVRIAQEIAAPDREAFAELSYARLEVERGRNAAAQQRAARSYELFYRIGHYMSGELRRYLGSLGD